MMKTNITQNPSIILSTYEKFHKNGIKYYLKAGLSPLFIWSLVLTSLITFILLYSPTPSLVLSPKHGHLRRNNHTTLIKPQQHYEEECDLFTGKWVRAMNVSQYTSTSCKTIPETKNCFQSGRKDTDFLNWRWKPAGCDLPRFDPNKFLSIVRGKKMAFVGDSVARNHMESLLCLLSQAEAPTDAYKDSEDRFRTWHFPSSNFTLMALWTTFLVNSEQRMVNNTGTGSFNLDLDKADQNWASKLPGLDYAIISTGHWFFGGHYLYNQGELIGCVYRSEPNVPTYQPDYAIRMSVRAALKQINDCKQCKGLLTFVRTYSPSHFENGVWNSGGTCNRTAPYSEEKAKERSYDFDVSEAQAEELEKARKEGAETGKRFRTLDVTPAMFMRGDGHPGEFYKWRIRGSNDCVHWCMPGPIDMWNDLLLAVMQKDVELYT